MKLNITSIALGLLASTAAAQISPVSSDSFEYGYPGLLNNESGGLGWGGAWYLAGTGGNEIVIFADGNGHYPFLGNDGVGNYAGQASGWGRAFRKIDTGPHSDIVDSGRIGQDGATVWVGFTTQAYFNNGAHYGTLSLYDSQFVDVLKFGSPWGANTWGIELDNGQQHLIPGADVLVSARLVVRIDYLQGDERCRMWVNPGVDHPTTPADLDIMVPDHRWDEISISSGSGAQFYWDEITVDKGGFGAGTVGSNFCSPANGNSAGMSGKILGGGTEAINSNDMRLYGEDLPQNKLCYFVSSMNQGFVNPPGSQGTLCLSGPIGRHNSQILDTGTSGSVILQVDLQNHASAFGPIGITPGDTWHYQLWYQDTNPTPTSNFTDGLTVTYN